MRLLQRTGKLSMVVNSESVRRYYDENTRLLLTLGQGTEGTIHRAVWAPGVKSRVEAMAHVDELVLTQVEELRRNLGHPLHIVDLGCGVCATLCRILQRTDASATGITISAKQVALANQRIVHAGLTQRVRCRQGDFCRLPADLAPAHLAYAIEAFVHASDPRAFFEQCAKLVAPGGRLILCDDFAASARVLEDPSARRWLQRFRKGWVIGSLLAPEQLRSLAHEHGFEHERSTDLTPYLELDRPRDRLIALLMHGFGWLPIRSSYWSMLYGGHALQVALKQGALKYLFSVWRRSA